MLTYSQNVQAIITYKKKVSQFSFKNSGRDSLYVVKRNSFLKEIFEKANEFEYLLDVNNEESQFYIKERLSLNNDAFSSTAANIGGTKGVFYVNISSREILNEKISYGQKFMVSSSLDNHKWTITSETKKIKGYTCFKATSIRIVENNKGVFKHPVEAWFTTEIPLNFGPAGYGGLPGLILDIEFQNIRIYCSKIELNPSKGVTIKRPKKGKLITQKQLDSIGNKMYEVRKRGLW